MSANTESRERTLADVSFETFQMATIVLEGHADRVDDENEADRATEALAELVAAWNAANARDSDE